MGWWSDLLRRLNGEPQNDEDEPSLSAVSDGQPVFECQTCFKVFESDQLRPICPECDSADVKALAA